MATIYERKLKKGTYFYLNYVDAAGERQRKPLGRITRKRAELKLQQKEHELRNSPTTQGKLQIKFSEYETIYLNDYLIKHPSSWEESRYMLQDDLSPMKNEEGILLKDLYLDELTSKDVNNFIYISIEKKRAFSTINRKIGVLSAFLNHAKDIGSYSVPDFKIKTLPKLKAGPPKFYDLDVLEKIIAAEKKYPHWWKLIANTGLRAGEFRNLKVKDCKDDGIWILSDPGNRTKSGDWRIIPMNDTIREILKDFDTTGEYLIPRFDKDMPKKRFRRLCERIEIEDGYWGIHCLRRTFCSQLVMAGKSMRAAQILMGHKSIKTTERYAFLSPSYLEGVMDDFGIG